MMLQSFQSCMQLQRQISRNDSKSEYHRPSSKSPTTKKKKKKKKKKPQQTSSSKRQCSSSADSYASLGSSSRPNSGSLTSSSGTLGSLSQSSGSGKTAPSSKLAEKKKHDRGPLKVSINETAELIEDPRDAEDRFSIDSATSQVREEREKLALEADVVENESTRKE